jgi:VanZ family protein
MVDGNGAYTGSRAGKYRLAVMHGPIEAEINRSSKISPSTAGLYHRSVIRLTIWLPVFAWMAMIMWFSTGQWSAENTGSILRPLLQWLLPWASAAQVAALHAMIRKTAHLTEYGVLATLWFIALTRERKWSPRPAAGLAVLVAIAWASLDELHQATDPSRTASVGDIGFDTAGAVLAASVARVGWRHAIRWLTVALLWSAAVGGAVMIVVNVASGVGSGVLWVTVPLAAALLVLRWRRRGAARAI